MCFIGETAAFNTFTHKLFYRRKKRGESFARPGGRGNQHMLARLYGRPRLQLRGRGRVKSPVEPVGDGGMERGKYGHASVFLEGRSDDGRCERRLKHSAGTGETPRQRQSRLYSGAPRVPLCADGKRSNLYSRAPKLALYGAGKR